MLLHVAECVVISIHEVKVFTVETEGSSDIQILSCEVLGGLTLKQLLARLPHPATLEKLPTKYTL